MILQVFMKGQTFPYISHTVPLFQIIGDSIILQKDVNGLRVLNASENLLIL